LSFSHFKRIDSIQHREAGVPAETAGSFFKLLRLFRPAGARNVDDGVLEKMRA